jgi:hypothetical protein
LVGHQLLQAGLALGGQERLASAQVSLRFHGAPRLEVLAHPAHGGHAVAAKRRDLGGAFALFVEFQDAFAQRHRYGFHPHILPSRPCLVKLYYLCKCSNYLKSIIDLVRSLDERRNDNQMIRLLFETCLDFVELSTRLPHPHFKELKYGDKKTDIEAQSKAAAEALVATRNQVAHAKSDYRPTGLELSLEELSDFNIFLEAAAVQTIRWYNRLPVHLKLKL